MRIFGPITKHEMLHLVTCSVIIITLNRWPYIQLFSESMPKTDDLDNDRQSVYRLKFFRYKPNRIPTYNEGIKPFEHN